jgi:hypothetical protein
MAKNTKGLKGMVPKKKIFFFSFVESWILTSSSFLFFSHGFA